MRSRSGSITSAPPRWRASKPVIDIQVSVASLESLGPFETILRSIGYVHRADPDPAVERVHPYFHCARR